MGEAEFGLIDGVLSTTAGWIGKVEVVEVEFDPHTVTYAVLLEHAVDRDCALRVFPRDDDQLELARAKVGDAVERSDTDIRRVEDQKYYLAQTALRFVPMTGLQATRINADVVNAADYLSPRQRRIWRAAEADASGFRPCVDRDLCDEWAAAWARTTATDRAAD